MLAYTRDDQTSIQSQQARVVTPPGGRQHWSRSRTPLPFPTWRGGNCCGLSCIAGIGDCFSERVCLSRREHRRRGPVIPPLSYSQLPTRTPRASHPTITEAPVALETAAAAPNAATAPTSTSRLETTNKKCVRVTGQPARLAGQAA